MPSRELQIIATLKDNVTKQLGGISGKLKANQANFKKMAMVGTAALAGLAYGAKKTINAYQEQERAEERLAHLTKTVSNATDEEIESLKEQARALQKVGVVGDEVVLMGQSQLATFALDAKQIELLTPSLMDMAVATKGVNATQEDMINIGNALGRAIDGGAGALTRYGISLSDAQKELYSTATREERVSMLAEILQGNFGGLNEATRETSEGGMKAIQNTMGDISENIGESLIPILDKLLKKLTPVVEKFAEWTSENPELVEKILLWSGGIAALVTGIGLLGLVLPSIIKGFGLIKLAIMWIFGGAAVKLILGMFSWVTVVIGLIIVAIWLLVKNWDKIFPILKLHWATFWEGVAEWASWIQENVIDPIVKVFEPLAMRIEEALSPIGTFFYDIIEDIKGYWNNLFGDIDKGMGGIGKKWGTGKQSWTEMSSGEYDSGQSSAWSPFLAKGGIVTKPTLATVGESGAEAIIPLNKMAGLGGGVTVNINSPIYGMEAKDVAEKLANTILNNLKSEYKM